jgi:hypothetical protein
MACKWKERSAFNKADQGGEKEDKADHFSDSLRDVDKHGSDQDPGDENTRRSSSSESYIRAKKRLSVQPPVGKRRTR